MVYILIFTLIFLISFVELLISQKNRRYFLLAFVPVSAFLCLFAGLRFETGFDYFSYKHIYEVVTLNNFVQNTVEIGFAFFVDCMKSIAVPFNLFLLFIAIFSIFLKAKFISRYSPAIFGSLLVYYSTGFLMNEMGQIRHGLAIGIIFVSFIEVFNKRPFWFVFWVVLATMFHTSAIIVLPVYFIVNSSLLNNKRMLIIIGIMSPLLFLDLKPLVRIFINYLPFNAIQGKMAYYLLSEQFGIPLGLNMSLLIRLSILLIMIRYSNEGRKWFNEFDQFKKLYFFGIVLYILMNSIAEFAIRTSLYFKSLECVILPMFFTLGKTKYDRVIMSLLVFLYASWSIFKILSDSDFSRVFLPYHNALLNLLE